MISFVFVVRVFWRHSTTPNAEIRFCASHIRSNFSKNWSGEDYKQVFWRAVRSCTGAEFDRSMETMKIMSKEAYDYLAAIPTKNWSRHTFSTKTKSGILLNNYYESFNNVLKSCRDKPILTMMEWIRRYVIKMIFSKQEGVEKYQFNIMSNARKQLEVAAQQSRDCILLQSGRMEFEVDHKDDRFVVNLKERKCGCFKWDLTGIPCVHAFACIMKKRLDPESFVHEAYTKATYKNVYSHAIHPLLGPKQWEKTTHPQPTPPPFRKMPGRPIAKKRKRDQTEVVSKVARKKLGNMCSNCGGVGHYKKTPCKNPGVARKKRGKKTSKNLSVTEEMPLTSSQPQLSQEGSSSNPATSRSAPVATCVAARSVISVAAPSQSLLSNL
ncbi:hypothetical protein vseg_021280 [Gypsophila vaccaria]